MGYRISQFEKKNCQQCGALFQPKNPQQKFCSNSCKHYDQAGKQKNGTNATCPVCGKSFYVQRKQIERLSPGGVHTCSYECRGKYYSGTNHHGYSKIELVCQYCGKTFLTHKGKENSTKFCSKECGKAFRHEKAINQLAQIKADKERKEIQKSKPITLDEVNSKPKAKRNPRVIMECKVCGKVTLQGYTTVQKGQGKYCGRDCFRKDLAIAMKERNGIHPRSNGGKREDLDGLYVRSSWEANYARYLNWLITQGQISKWEYEPETFEFHKITKGNKFYTPDFKITNIDGTIEYHEVKGWLDNDSKVKLNRFARYYPDIKLVLIDKPVYTAIARTMRPLIQEWEWNEKHSN